jgi:purine-cytosine permease-like protein
VRGFIAATGMTDNALILSLILSYTKIRRMYVLLNLPITLALALALAVTTDMSLYSSRLSGQNSDI